MRKIVILFTLGLLQWQSYATNKDSLFIRENYTKKEYEIPMRDGETLFTAVYQPKDQSQKYPMLLKRTCYSIRPYGEENYPNRLGPSSYLMREKFIFVYQDVRGRYMSTGEFDNMRPNVPGNKKKDIDESSDTFDTIEWLLKNLKGHNGKVGQWGISYPGFYTAAALPDAHPALVASSPQAPIADFYFDDFHHNGAFLQSYLKAYPVFGVQKDGKTTESWFYDQMLMDTPADGYDWHLNLGPLKNAETFYADNFFWRQVVDHPNYDEFWQARSILPHLKEIDHAVLTVGGWFDAEDLYGPLNIYKTIEQTSPDAKNTIVMGPWSHGDWARERGFQAVNHIYFGDSLSTFYQKEIEFPFFTYYLKGKGEGKFVEAFMFDTGLNQWESYESWPPVNTPPVIFSFEENGKLVLNGNPSEKQKFTYISDPEKPVPYRSEVEGVTFTPRKFMTDDQRHAARRPDVLTFQTEVLDEPITLAGEILAKLRVSLNTDAADFVVKLIDVFPPNHKNFKHNPENIQMGSYQMLVRSEVIRGRYRNNFENPEPFVPNEITAVDLQLQDILHTFKQGHRIMIQIHSTWFPYIDRNPQKYVDNIYKAEASDFQPAIITIYGSSTVQIGNDIIEEQKISLPESK
jgi:hypothetical protein